MQYFIDWFLSGFSTPRSTVAQLIGFLPLLLSFFVFLQPARKKVLLMKAGTEVLWAAHYFILGQIPGGAINTLNVVRDYVFAKTKSRKLWLPLLFCLLTVLCGIPGYRGPVSLFGSVGSCLAIVGFWQKDLLKLRLLNLAGVSLWVVYGIWTVSIPTIIANVITICSILTALIKEKA